MADAELEAFIEITTKSKGMDSAIQKETQKLQQIVPAANKAEKATDNFFKTLKKSAGRRSELGETVEMLRGAGALMGITMLGEGLAKATDRMKELRQEFQDGKISALEMQQGLLESLPLIGGFAKAGHNLHDMFSTESDYVNMLKTEAEVMDKIHEVRQKQMAEDKHMTRGYQNTTAEFKGESKLEDEHPHTYQHAVQDEQNKFDHAVRELDQSFQDMIDKKTLEANEQKKLIRDAMKSKTTYKDILGNEYTADELDRLGGGVNQERAKNVRQAVNDMNNLIAQVDSVTAGQIAPIRKAGQEAAKAISEVHRKILEKLKQATELLHEIGNQTELVGKNPLEKFKAELGQQGLPDEAIGNLMKAKGQLLGAEMKDSLMSNMEKYTHQQDYIKQLMDSGSIDGQTFWRAQQKNAGDMISSVKTNSVEGMFRENIKNRFIDSGINNQIADLNNQIKDKGATADNTSVSWDASSGPVAENTKAVEKNNDAQAKALDAITMLAQAIKDAKPKAVFGD